MDDLPLRFSKFISYWDGSEDIDDLLRQEDHPGLQRADYMLFDRKVVIEQKILESEPTSTIETVLREICEERGIRIYGTVSVGQILEKLPDRDAVAFKLWNRLNLRIEKLFATADKQIRDSKLVFERPDSIGLLVVLNQDVSLISPKGAALKFNGMFLKDEEDGSARYGHIDAAIIISEAHYVESDEGKLSPFVTVYSHRSQNGKEASQIAENICRAWSWYNAYGFEQRSFDSLEFKTFVQRRIGLA